MKGAWGIIEVRGRATAVPAAGAEDLSRWNV
jgi:hypothetical protein